MRHITTLSLMFSLLVPALSVQAKDEELCNTLGNLVPLASSKFQSIRGSKTGDDTWKAKLMLPSASKCELTVNDEKEVSYGCDFQLSAGRKGDVVALNYADNVMACLPDLERAQDGRTTFLTSNKLTFQFTPFSRYVSFNLYYRAPD